jgi:hypothetical protein
LPIRSRDEASPEFTKELELTVHRGEDPVQRAPLLEVREVVPEDQAPSPSLDAFNKSFGTSHRGELLSVGFKTTSIRSKTSKILTLWKSPVLVDETGGEGSEQPGGVAQDSEKGLHSAPGTTPSSQGKASSSWTKKVTMQNLSKQGSFLFIAFWYFSDSRIFCSEFSHEFFQSSRVAGAPFQALRPRAQWAEWVGGCDRLPRTRGYRAVMMACGRLRGRRGRGGARPSAKEYFSCN